MIEQNYRPDVDGLRAVAVVLILLFHAHLGLTGGFVGVDVFFVISGYLITGLILRQQQAGTFRLAWFWQRRIRRIIPAAACMAFVTLVAGFVLLLPIDYEDLAKSTLAQQVMLSNIFFWRTSGYFQGTAELKPLLHTWSLAVEEQFYLLYPLVLSITARFHRRHVVFFLALAAVASLALSEWGVWHYPSATFYLLPSRAWELLLGGLLCFCPPLSIAHGRRAESLSLAGIIMIAAAAVGFDSGTRFPGLWALLPCVGTACIIYSNTTKLTFVGHLLALKPVVFVGLISYSLYLWHWPLFAISRYLLGYDLQLAVVVLILFASFVLAYLSWRFVETPFRRSISSRYQRLVVFGICATAPLLMALSALVLVGDGFPARVPAEAIRYRAVGESNAFLQEVTTADVLAEQLPTVGLMRVWPDKYVCLPSYQQRQSPVRVP